LAGAASVTPAMHRMVNSLSLPGAGVATNDKIAAIYRIGGGTDPRIPVVTVPAGENVASPATAARVARVLGAARVSPAVQLVDYRTTGDRVFMTANGRSAYALAFVPPDGSGGTALAAAMRTALRAAAAPGWSAGLTGNGLLSAATPQKKGAGSLAASMLGGLAVLLFVFASLLAFLPLIIAAVSVLGAFLLVLGLTHLTDVSQIVTFLIALIGLGVAIDYSLLVVTRWREERARIAGAGAGRRTISREQNYAAIEAAMAGTGRSVIFSGLTVAVGLLALVTLARGLPAQHRVRRNVRPADIGRGRGHAAARHPRDRRAAAGLAEAAH
jgi:putative drug exporter of the RND superfamily